LLSLSDRGLVKPSGNGYVLTVIGQSKADECWDLADAHAKETFKRFSKTEVDNFTDVLRQLIANE
jgi:DNA-binding MarR family transcriptional regulator